MNPNQDNQPGPQPPQDYPQPQPTSYPQQPPQYTQAPQYTPPSEYQPVSDQYSVDYLNEIAPPLKQSRGPGKLMWIIIGLVMATLLVIGLSLVLNSRPSDLDRATELYVRMDSLRTIADRQHVNLRDNELRANNTSYRLFLGNAIRDIEEPLNAAGINKARLDENLRNSESELIAEYNEKFEDARLNVTLDSTYAREMLFQLSILDTMMRSFYNQTNTPALREFLETTNTNLSPIAKSFDEFTAAQ